MNKAEKIGAEYAMISSGIISMFVVIWGVSICVQNEYIMLFGGVITFLFSSYFLGKWAGMKILKDGHPWLIGIFTSVFSSLAVFAFSIFYILIFEHPGDVESVLMFGFIVFIFGFIYGIIPMIIIGSFYGHLVNKQIRKIKIEDNSDLSI